MTGLTISNIETDYDVTRGKLKTVQQTLLAGLTVSKTETDYGVTGGELKTVQLILLTHNDRAHYK